MKDFIVKNKNLAVIVTSLLILCSVFISLKKGFFYSPPAGEKPVFLPATEEGVFLTSPTATEGAKTNFVPVLVFAVLLTIGGIVAGVVLRKSAGAGEEKKVEVTEERDKKRKEDIERLQAMVEAYYKLKGVYPNPTQFEELKVDLEPPPKDPLDGQKVGETGNTFDYYYDNWDIKASKNTTAAYRLWAFLENENDPMVKDGKYLVTPETYGKKLVPSEVPEEKMPEIQLQKPETAAFATAPQEVYLPAQDKITQILLIIFSVVVFIITIVNAYMVYKLNQLTVFLMQLLGRGL